MPTLLVINSMNNTFLNLSSLLQSMILALNIILIFTLSRQVDGKLKPMKIQNDT